MQRNTEKWGYQVQLGNAGPPLVINKQLLPRAEGPSATCTGSSCFVQTNKQTNKQINNCWRQKVLLLQAAGKRNNKQTNKQKIIP